MGGSIVAHRGASATHPENTLAAFEAAIVAEADTIEFDVRLTREGVPVVMHDPSVARTTDGHGLVRDLALAEFRELRAGGEPVPSLDDVLALASSRVGVDIEIKNVPGEPDFEPEGRTVVEAILGSLDATSFSGEVLLSCFDPFTLRTVKQLAPDLVRGLLSARDVEASAAVGFACSEGLDWSLPQIDRVEEAGAACVSAAHEAGLRLGTWITDEPARAEALFSIGLDAVATNDPAALVAARRTRFG